MSNRRDRDRDFRRYPESRNHFSQVLESERRPLIDRRTTTDRRPLENRIQAESRPTVEGRPPQIRSSASSRVDLRDYGRRSHTAGLRDPSPPSDEEIPLPVFNRDALQEERELILRSFIPYDDDVPGHPLCEVMEQSLKNQETIIRTLTHLASVLGRAGEYVEGFLTLPAVSRKTDMITTDLAEREEFLQELNKFAENPIGEFLAHVKPSDPRTGLIPPP